MIRSRITYWKTEALRYTGNLDLQKIWERFLRRAGLPVAYSQGFHPQPRIQQACPLPLGFLSENELVDVYFDDDSLTGECIEQSLKAMPYPGLNITDVEIIPLSEPSLSSMVTATEVRVEFFDPADPLSILKQIATILGSAALPRIRRDKTYDLRPLIEELTVSPTPIGKNTTLQMKLSARQGATGRPEEVLAAMGYDPFSARYTRTKIIFNN